MCEPGENFFTSNEHHAAPDAEYPQLMPHGTREVTLPASRNALAKEGALIQSDCAVLRCPDESCAFAGPAAYLLLFAHSGSRRHARLNGFSVEYPASFAGVIHVYPPDDERGICRHL